MASKQILPKNSLNCDKTDLPPHFSCEEISPHDRFFSTFLNMTNLHDIYMTLFTMWKYFYNWQFVMCRISLRENILCGEFLHMTDFLHRHRQWCLWQISGMLECSSKSRSETLFWPWTSLFMFWQMQPRGWADKIRRSGSWPVAKGLKRASQGTPICPTTDSEAFIHLEN